ncbi:TPA: LOW QUALITY PROTEIN: hypothetical protein N0F65_006701 [Lagenidium giganteum]|uniref:SWIM-type domain-containing protein n=1 Tax=Lagenidium giganteum TaxID=4803 RepID=A0AAV2Z9N3_9STRA|nr:TPA: LOW QUALITY PROTEIN: hypothetical protein N0F65_006701 [Lagenidium giganteum]
MESEPVLVEEVDQREFNSWHSLQAYLAIYARQTYQSGNSVRARNASIEAHLRAQFEHAPTLLERELSRKLIPESFDAYSKLNACVQWSDDANAWCVHITKQSTMHNPEVSEERYRDYPVSRRVQEPEVLETVASMAQHGAPCEGILAYIKENSTANPSLRDVHNLIARMNADKYAQFTSVEERVHKFLRHVARLFTDEQDIVKVVSFADCAHEADIRPVSGSSLSRHNAQHKQQQVKHFSFMIQDALGGRQHIQHSLIADERRETQQTVCDQFKANNPKWEDVRCVVIDKDFTEMAVIEKAFPDARVLLCQLHVLHYLHNEIAKAKYGMTDWQKGNMRSAITSLVYSSSETAYDQQIEFIRTILSAPEKIAKWFDYFESNRNACRGKWCSYLRCSVPHLGNNTIELSEAEAACEQVQALRRKIRERSWRRGIGKIGRHYVADADSQINALAGAVSPYAVDLVRPQYEFAMRPSTQYKQYPIAGGKIMLMLYIPPTDEDDRDDDEEDEDDYGVMVSDIPEEYAVNTSSWLCSCPFMMTRLLPCRHVICLRRGKSAVIPLTKIHPRWRLSNSRQQLQEDNPREEEVADASQTRRLACDPPDHTLSSNERFTRLYHVAKTIAEVGSAYGTSHVLKIEASLTAYLVSVRRREIPSIPSPTDNHVRTAYHVRTEDSVRAEDSLRTADHVQTEDNMRAEDDLLSPCSRIHN